MKRVLLLVAYLGVAVGSVRANTFYVSTAGSATYDGTSPTFVSGTIGPKLTIQQGIDLAGGTAGTSHTVEVVAGTYTQTASLTLKSTHNGKSIVVQPYNSGTVTITSSGCRPLYADTTQTSGSWVFKNLAVSTGYTAEVFRNQNTNPIVYEFEGCSLTGTTDTNTRILGNEASLASPGYIEFRDCALTSSGYSFRFSGRCGLRLTGGTSVSTDSTIGIFVCAGAHSSPLWLEVLNGCEIHSAGGFLVLDYTTPCTDVVDHVLIWNSTLDLAKTLINSCSVSTPWMSQYIDRWVAIGSDLTTADNFGVFGPEPEGADTGCSFAYASASTGTFTKSGHNICTGVSIDVTWTESSVAKARRNVTVGSRTTTTVVVSGGTGDDYPSSGGTDWTLRQRTVNPHPFVEMVWRGNTLTCTKDNPTHTICFMVGCDGMVWDDNRLICTSETFATGYGGFVQKSDYTTFTNSVVVSGNVAATFKGCSNLRCYNNTFYSKSGTAFDLTIHQDVGDDSDYPRLGYPIMPDVRNNIFCSVDGLAAQFGASGTTLNTEHPIIDHNLYYSGGANIMAMAGVTIAKSGGAAAIQAAWAANMTDAGPSRLNDAHSVIGDPRFRSAATNDFFLLGGSPSRGTGYPTGMYMGAVPTGGGGGGRMIGG